MTIWAAPRLQPIPAEQVPVLSAISRSELRAPAPAPPLPAGFLPARDWMPRASTTTGRGTMTPL
jgi:hypothetical protein